MQSLNPSSHAQLAPSLPVVANHPLLLNPWFKRFLMPRLLCNLYEQWQQQSYIPLWRLVLRDLDITYRIDPAEHRRVPAVGPAVVVANHPCGLMEGVILCDVLTRVRPDVRVLTNHLLAAIPPLQQHCIAVDPFGGREAKTANQRGIREAQKWLERGGMLLIFPAGEVSSWQPSSGRVEDRAWRHTASRLIRNTGAVGVPIFVRGRNSLAFHLSGLLHPRLRTLRLTRELLNKRGLQVDLRIGAPVSAATVDAQGDDTAATQYLRWRTYLLGQAKVISSEPLGKRSQPIETSTDVQLLQREVAQLPVLFEDQEFQVLLAEGAQAPHVLHEIGRGREVTFRQVGEGTGKGIDIDAFDKYYQHLVLWHRDTNSLAGAYRLVRVDTALAQKGAAGLYTQTLFRYDSRFFDELGPAWEVGRSFVMARFQRHYGALLNLWKGLGRYIAYQPDAPTLIGAVSISGLYQNASRSLMARYFQQQQQPDGLSRWVRPRVPMAHEICAGEPAHLPAALPTCESLSRAVGDIELDGKGLPVLLRHYLKLGGRVLSFNVDKNFAEALDGLVVVNLRQTDPRLLSRYMGDIGMQKFCRRTTSVAAPHAQAKHS